MAGVFALHSLARILPDLPDPEIVREELFDRATKPPKNAYTAMHASLALGIAGDRCANEFHLEYLSGRNRSKFRQENHSAMAMALGLTRHRGAAIMASCEL